MELNDIQFIFNRSLTYTFERKKLLIVSMILLLCGLLVIFFRGLAIHTGQWLTMSLAFLPIFLCSGVLLSIGVLLIRVYHDQVKKRKASFRNVLSKSWDVIVGSSYLSIPLILAYLLLWMFLGIFFLLNDIPGLGGVFNVLLAFAPFLLNLGAIVLSVLSVSLLFFVTPIVALRGMNRIQLSQVLAKRFQKDLFFTLFLATIASLPMLLLSGILVLAAAMTEAVCVTCNDPLYIMLQWFFIMVPFALILSPTVVFFFNFAAESHVLMQRSSAR